MSLVYAIAASTPTRPSCRAIASRTFTATPPITPDRQRQFPSKMTDGEWAPVRPLLPLPSWPEVSHGSEPVD